MVEVKRSSRTMPEASVPRLEITWEPSPDSTTLAALTVERSAVVARWAKLSAVQAWGVVALSVRPVIWLAL